MKNISKYSQTTAAILYSLHNCVIAEMLWKIASFENAYAFNRYTVDTQKGFFRRKHSFFEFFKIINYQTTTDFTHWWSWCNDTMFQWTHIKWWWRIILSTSHIFLVLVKIGSKEKKIVQSWLFQTRNNQFSYDIWWCMWPKSKKTTENDQQHLNIEKRSCLYAKLLKCSQRVQSIQEQEEKSEANKNLMIILHCIALHCAVDAVFATIDFISAKP